MTEQTIITRIIQEEWRSISQYMNYQVSNIGRIRNISTGRILKPGQNTSGYLQVVLCDNNIRKTSYVHRLVACEFTDNPDNKADVDHIDHNKQNNFINNLRWASKSENNMNRSKKDKPCSSTFKGVSFDKRSQKWWARIKTDTGEKQISLGYFVDEIDAARAYNKKATELFGAFANLNDISD